MLYVLLQNQLLDGDEVPQWAVDIEWIMGTKLMRGKKSSKKRDQTVSDNMTKTLGRKYNDLKKAIKSSCKRGKNSGLKPSAKK